MALNKPNSEQAERACIGAVLVDETQVGLFVNTLLEEDFYNSNNKIIYNAICALYENKINVDITSLSNYLSDHDQLDKIGGIAELLSLTEGVVSSNIISYINILQDKTNLRNLSVLLEETVNRFDIESAKDTDEFLNDFEKNVIKITRNKHYEEFKKSNELIHSFKRALNSNDPNELGLSTGFSLLDYLLLGGWHKGDLIVLGARTGVGKTAIALNFAFTAACKKQVPVLYFSLEMDAESLMARLISMAGNVDGKKVQTLKLTQKEDLIRVEQACKRLENIPLYFDDTPNIKLIDLEKKARMFKQKNPSLGLIIVDYMQILNVANNKSSREQEVAKISIALKALAREIDVPIIALAQLNRNSTGGKEFNKKNTEIKKPEITELRESGQIEQDADVILLLHRPEAYNGTPSDNPQTAELLLKKNRKAEPGTIELVFTPKFCKFENIDKNNEI